MPPTGRPSIFFPLIPFETYSNIQSVFWRYKYIYQHTKETELETVSYFGEF